MEFGTSIRIYLKDQTVTGIKFGEIVNKTIQSISCPRNRFSELSNHSESKRPGVYFLFGSDDETSNLKVYIGESENVYERLQNHAINKDFWSEVILFVSKDDNLTKSHVKYLESRAVEIGISTKRYVMDNGNNPQPPLLPIPDKSAMEEFLTYIKTLIGILGHKVLEDVAPVKVASQKNISITIPLQSDELTPTTNNLELFFNAKGLYASALLTDEGIVVLENSEASLSQSELIQIGYKELRESLINDGTLKLVGDKYIFTKNQLFFSPSSAACVIAGTSRNGRADWKNANHVSLNDIEKNSLHPIFPASAN